MLSLISSIAACISDASFLQVGCWMTCSDILKNTVKENGAVARRGAGSWVYLAIVPQSHSGTDAASAGLAAREDDEDISGRARPLRPEHREGAVRPSCGDLDHKQNRGRLR